MSVTFEGDISSADHITISAAIAKAQAAASEAGIKFSEIKIDMRGDSLVAAAGDVWVCKDNGTTMVCRKL